MLLFVGLGNPTPDSENNRHNVGFKIIDTINKKFSLSKQKPKFKGLLTTEDVIKIWQGGMSFHGGLIGVIFASFLFAKNI